jgi:hypothetical protein
VSADNPHLSLGDLERMREEHAKVGRKDWFESLYPDEMEEAERLLKELPEDHPLRKSQRRAR